MGKLAVIIVCALAMVGCSSLQATAGPAGATKVKGPVVNASTDLGNSPVTPVDWFGLLATLTGSRQAEAAVLTPMLSSFLGLVTTGKVLPFITPILVTYLILPLMAMVKTVAKALMLISVLAWMLSAFVPVFLGYLGVAGAGAMVARAMESTPYLNYLNLIDLSAMNVAEHGMHYFEMDSQDCRMMMSCKAGEFMLTNYPTASKLLASSGLLGYLETPTMRADPYTRMALEAMQGRVECGAKLPACPGMQSLEAFLDPQTSLNVTDVNDFFTRVASSTTTTSTTTPSPLSTSTSLPSNADLVVNAIRRLAQNYYGYSLTN